MDKRLIIITDEDIMQIKSAIKKLLPISEPYEDFEILSLQSIVNQYEIVTEGDKMIEKDRRHQCICVDILNSNPDPIANPDCPIHGSWTNAFAN